MVGCGSDPKSQAIFAPPFSRSTAVTSNIALGDWGRYLGDATLTAAILDRLAMHAIRIDITGPSFRQHVAKTRAERAAAT